MKIKNSLSVAFIVPSFILLWLFCDKPYDPDSNQGPEGCRDTVLTVLETEELGINIHATDPDNDILDWSILEGPRHGSTDKKFGTIESGNELTYISDNLVAAATDTLKISISDFEVSKHITVIINITADNDPPYIPDLDTIKIIKGQDFGINLLGIDPEGLPVTWEIMVSPVNGILTKLRDTISDSAEATYKSDSSSDSFEYRVSDGQLFSQNTTVNIINYSTIVLQQGLSGYTGCEDASIGMIIEHNNSNPIIHDPYFYSDTTYVCFNSDTLYFLFEC
jgi:hypothetical protein